MNARRRPTPSPATRLATALPAWGAVCFFASGAAGLMYEVAWSKQLSYLLGNSLHAVATVVAAFLGGLALGARLLGVPLSRRGNGGRTYAALELGVGLLGVISLPVLRGLDPLVGEMYRALGGEGFAFALARFALLFALLVPPAALMGATLPVLVGYFEHELVGPALARLYAINTFGAVTGSVVGGFALLPGIGLMLTSWVAAAINVAVAALAWFASSKARLPAGVPKAAPSPEAPSSPPTAAVHATAQPGASAPRTARPLTGKARTAFALLFALSGFAALAFQIAWVRLFALMFGSSVYSFSAVLGVYLLGLALGSALIARSMSRGVSLVGFGILQVGIAVVAAFMLHTFSRIPQWVFDLSGLAQSRWVVLFAGEVGITAVLLLLPCGLLGAAFPVATRLLQARDGGHAAGFAYAVNTLGTIAGSLAAGFWLVPTIGVQGTHLTAVLMSLGVGLGSLALASRWAPAAVRAPAAKGMRSNEPRSRDAGRILLYGLSGLTAVIALVVSAPRWDPSLMSIGLYRPVQFANFAAAAAAQPGQGSLTERGSQMERVLYYREGLNGSVLVGTGETGKNRWLRINGKIDASTGDMGTQVLLGLFPAALADSGARALVIGLGSGVTAAAVLAGGASSTEVVELEPAVVDASKFFFPPGEGPLDDPRTKLYLGDARTHLAYGSGRYGIIVSEPSNPWMAGVNNLFTVDFYRRVRARLEPDGVFCQWLQLYELSPEVFASLAASFLEVFPQGHMFSILDSDELLLVAAPDDRSLSLERLRQPAARHMLTMANIPEPEGLSAYYCGPVSSLREMSRGAPLNRDDRPAVEYRAPRDMFRIGRESVHGDPRVRALVPFVDAPPPGPLFAAWTPRLWYEAGARVMLSKGQGTGVERLARAADEAGLGIVAHRLRAQADSAAAHQNALMALQEARAMLGAGRGHEALDALERATRLEPSNGRAWVALADARRLAGDATGARAALENVAQNPDSIVRAEAEIVAGIVEIGQARPEAAVVHFRQAERWGPRHARSYLLPAESRLGAGDPAGARETLLRGLAALPGDPEISAALARLGALNRQ